VASATELLEARELFRNLTLRELRSKYKRSALGWAWSLLNPLATMAIFSFVFLVVFKAKPYRGDPSGLKNFPLYLLCGLLSWNYLSTGLTGGMGAPIQNAALIKKVYFPREILTASVVASWVVQFGIELSVLAAALVIVGNNVFPYLPGVLFVIAIQSIFVYGLALGFGAINVYFRDVQHFLGIALQFWFYSTPIVYNLSQVPKTAHILGREVAVRTLYELNPMVRFVGAYRNLVYDLRYPPIGDLLYLVGVSVLVLLIGRGIFLKFEGRFAEEL
jgi:ABC-2 type transport system permease protein